MMFSKENLNFLLVISLFVILIYGQTLAGDFVFDDRNIIGNYATLSDASNLNKIFLMPFWSEGDGLYRPVTLISFTANFVLFGGSPFGFHLVNLAIYIFSCFLIFVFFRKFLKNEILAKILAILFLVLPIHTEVVANIIGRSELLSLLFSLLLFVELLNEKPNWWRSGLWLLLSIAAKENGMAALPIALIILYLKENKINKEVLDKYFRLLSSLLVAVLVYFTARFFALGPNHFFGVETSLIENPLLFTDAFSRAATALGILWMYVVKTFWPLDLCSDYSFNQIPVISNFLNPGTISGLLFLFFAALVWVYSFIKKEKAYLLASSLFLFSFLPASNILFPTGTIAGERLFYYPSLGICLILSYVFAGKFKILPDNKAPIDFKITKAALVILMLFFGLISAKRAGIWVTEEKLFISAYKCAPNSVLSLSNMGALYYLKGDLANAELYMKKSIEISPIYSKGLNNLGLVYWKKGDIKMAKNMYFQAIEQKFPYYGAFENLFFLYGAQGDRQRAEKWLSFIK